MEKENQITKISWAKCIELSIDDISSRLNGSKIDLVYLNFCTPDGFIEHTEKFRSGITSALRSVSAWNDWSRFFFMQNNKSIATVNVVASLQSDALGGYVNGDVIADNAITQGRIDVEMFSDWGIDDLAEVESLIVYKLGLSQLSTTNLVRMGNNTKEVPD